MKLESGFNKHDSSAEISFQEEGTGDSVSEASSLSGGSIAGIVIAALVVILGLGYFLIRCRSTAGAHAAQGDDSHGSEF